MDSKKGRTILITIIATKKSWIEGIAVEQLKQVATLEGVQSVVGLPDLHAGPVGIAMASDNMIYPHLVGNDIGCGLGFWQTDCLAKKAKLDRWIKRLNNLDTPFEGDITPLLQKYSLDEKGYLSALGTIGHGNHFAELQKVETVYNQPLFEQYGLEKERVTLLIHSGSRGLGRQIMDDHIAQNGSGPLIADSPAGKYYLKKHNDALQWGRANRELIANRFMDSLNIKGENVLDLTHNSVTKEKLGESEVWMHRKGANPSNEGIALIAGSRGTLSYLVKPTPKTFESNLSIAHGAGRKWKRSEMEKRVKKQHTLSSLLQTSLGSRVICEDRKLLYEEAPDAYKSIKQVIYDLEEFGLIEVIATYRPLITYKTRNKR